MSESNAPEGSIGRLLTAISVGTQQAVRARDTRGRKLSLKEVELQFQYAISGVAAPIPSFAPVTVNFPYELFFAPGQRDSTLKYPHFTYGSHTQPAVGVMATVEAWLHEEENGAINGARVGVGAVGAGAFKGFVHLTFQGYALPIT